MVEICENRVLGHHSMYFNSLLKINGVKLKFIDMEVSEDKKNIYLYFNSRKKLLKEYLKSNEKIVHILTGDYIYILPIIRKISSKRKKVIMTIHHVPHNKFKLLLLKNFSKKIDVIVVHSIFLKEELSKVGIKNVEVIDYPSFHDYSLIDKKETIKKKYNISTTKTVISLLGGTRNDKGADILLESLNYLDDEKKSNITINISGKEEYFTKEFILKNLKNVDFKLNLKELTDEEFCENVLITDIMIMPYRKTFGGNSGPMTEAIVNKIPCIAPRELNIGKIITQNNIGETFECENSKDLAEMIKKVMDSSEQYYKENFHEMLTETIFLQAYEKLYFKLLNEIN